MKLNEMNRTFRVIDAERLVPFKGQPFLLPEPEQMRGLVRSISENGVSQPVVVRPSGEGKYEILSGLLRWKACRKAGMRDIPCMILDIEDDDEAAVLMIDLNLTSRNGLLMSERARACEMRMRALKRLGKYPVMKDEPELFPGDGDRCAEMEKYARLNALHPDLLDETDRRGRGYLQAAVDLSYLDGECQQIVADMFKETGFMPGSAEACYLRSICSDGNPGEDIIRSVIGTDRGPELIMFSRAELAPYFPGGYETPGTIKKRIREALGHSTKHRTVS